MTETEKLRSIADESWQLERRLLALSILLASGEDSPQFIEACAATVASLHDDFSILDQKISNLAYPGSAERKAA